MTRDDIQKLLGGYATGTLSAAERDALFQAALEDQSLFDALVDESALKELLDDPNSRAYLLAALPPKPKAVVKPWPVWSWAAAGSIAAVVVGVFLLRGPAPRKPVPQLVAMATRPELDTGAPARLEPAQPMANEKMRSREGAKELYSKLKDARIAGSAGMQQAQPVAPALSQSQGGFRAKDEKADADAENREMAKSTIRLVPPPPPAAAPPAAGLQAEADTDKGAAAGALGRPAEGKAASTDSVSAAVSPQKNLPQRQTEAIVATAAAPQSMAAVTLSSATAAQPGARQLFYGAAPVGDLRFAAGRADLARTAKKIAPAGSVVGVRYAILRRGPEGNFAEVDPATVFQSGDALRLSVESNAPGYLAVWDGGAALANLRVIARTQYTIPPDGAIELSAPPREKKLLVVFSRQPESSPAPVASGLLMEQSPENSVYVASASANAPVSFSITLTYR